MSVRPALVSFAARHWPFAYGAGRIVETFGRDMALVSGERVVRTRDGFDMTVLADDFIGRHLLLAGSFDRPIAMLLVAFSEPGDQIIDVGANIGYISALLLCHVADSHVVAIEPQPDLADLLTRNLLPFGRHRFVEHRVALSDSPGAGFLHINRSNRGGSHIVDADDGDSIAIPLVDAAAIFDGLERLDLMKIDIEGHEEPVFRSALGALERLQPRAILFEDHAGKAAPSGAIGVMLAAIGYRVYGIRKALRGPRLAPVTEASARQCCDFLAVSTRRDLPSAGRALLSGQPA